MTVSLADRLRFSPINRNGGVAVEFSPASGTLDTQHLTSSGSLEWLPVVVLQFDRSYQRPPSKDAIRKIARAFDPESFGVIVVSRRSDGSLFVVDGQHRCEAIREMGWLDQKVPCVVHENMTVEEEARMFYRPQVSARKLSAQERFRAQLRSGDARSLRLVQCAREHGYEILLTSTAGDGNSINAVNALEKVVEYSDGFEVLQTIFSITRAAWPESDEGLQADLLTGMSSFIRRYGKTMNQSRLVHVLSRTTIKKLSRTCAEFSSIFGGRRDASMGRAILKAYNTDLRSSRLPDWDSR